MLAKRIIPCLDVKQGRVVKGVNFVDLRDAGDPVEHARAYDAAGADELVFLDITASHERRDIMIEVVRRVADQIFIPFAVGGGVRTVEDYRAILLAGADKVAANTAAVENPEVLTEAAMRFGSQAVVVAIDAKREARGEGRGAMSEGRGAKGEERGAKDEAGGESRGAKDGGTDISREPRNEGWSIGQDTANEIGAGESDLRPWPHAPRWTVYTHGGRIPTGRDAVEWAREAEARGAGEILLTSMDRDGTRDGYDLELTRAVAAAVSVPVIASGGAGRLSHFAEALTQGHADAVLAASLFHFGELTIEQVKDYVAGRGIPVRRMGVSL